MRKCFGILVSLILFTQLVSYSEIANFSIRRDNLTAEVPKASLQAKKEVKLVPNRGKNMKLEVVHTGPFEVNTYVLMDEESKEAVLIDVGGEFEDIKKTLDKKGYKINFILNTHGHFDHVLGEVEIQQKYPEIPILMHKDDTSHLLYLQQEMSHFGISSETPPLKLNEFIDETSSLFIGKNRIEIFHTPGHSKGSLSFYVDGKVFTGDALFYRSIGRTDFYDGDYDALIYSIKTKLLVMPDETVVYPGHGPSSTIKDEKKHNPYLK